MINALDRLFDDLYDSRETFIRAVHKMDDNLTREGEVLVAELRGRMSALIDEVETALINNGG